MIAKINDTPNIPARQNLVGKAVKSKANKLSNDDSHNSSQKDVIVRRIKKKSENPKTSYSASVGFGHK